MPSTQIPALPSMAQYPEAAWRTHMMPEGWSACLDAWIALAEVHLSLSASDFTRLSLQDQSLISFLLSYARETARSSDSSFLDLAVKTKTLWKNTFYLSSRMLEAKGPPTELLGWEFLADVSKAYGKKHTWNLIAIVWKRSPDILESSLKAERDLLIKNLDSGLHGNVKSLEIHLKRLNHLLHCSPDTAAFLMAGSDFLDGLINCYKLMNPPLRKAILSTAYLSILGLTEGAQPKLSLLTDQLYALKAAADAHKAGPTNVNDSLVAELVTVTPILKQLQERIESSETGSSRAKPVLAGLETFKKAGDRRPKKFVRRKVNKGKGVAGGSGQNDGHSASNEVHIHQMSFISQVQDLFPDLGSGFVAKLLDEYKEDVEQVVSHLLDDSLPAHLNDADRAEDMGPTHQMQNYVPDIIPRSTPPLLPTRRNVFDDDEFDQLAVDTSRLHFGRRNPEQTVDDILKDRTTAPNKAAILSALAAFDSDDDERDDTYDVDDVGGTVDSATPGDNPEEREADVRDATEEALFHAFKMTPDVFGRDAATRRAKSRISLREETKMTDEAIEGWALMLSRDPRRMGRLEMKFSNFTGAQKELAPTSWRASPAGSGTEESDMDGGNRGRGGHRGRGGGRGRGGRGGSVAGPASEKATEVARQRKEANKGSSANHNRRDQRAKKMARGGFPG